MIGPTHFFNFYSTALKLFFLLLFSAGCVDNPKRSVASDNVATYNPYFTSRAFSSCLLHIAGQSYGKKKYKNLVSSMKKRDKKIFNESPTLSEVREMKWYQRIIAKNDFLSIISFLDQPGYDRFMSQHKSNPPFWLAGEEIYRLNPAERLTSNDFKAWVPGAKKRSRVLFELYINPAEII